MTRDMDFALGADPAPRPRRDLPAEVEALARAHGVPDDPVAAPARLRQSGVLRQGPDDAWMRFTARQSVSVARLGFAWRARVGPLGLVSVTDWLDGDDGGGRVSLAGLPALGRAEGGPAVLQGELQRYLAELPWAPDAIRLNAALRWRVGEAGVLHAAAAAGSAQGEVRFTLDGAGRIAAVDALRPRLEGRTTVERPWRGVFGDYRPVGGRMIPLRAEVSWSIDGRAFVCWRGRIEHWAVRGEGRALPASRKDGEAVDVG